MSSSKKLTEPHTPLPLHSVYVYSIQFTYSHREGGGGYLTREKWRGAIEEIIDQKAGVKIPT